MDSREPNKNDCEKALPKRSFGPGQQIKFKFGDFPNAVLNEKK
jgi:hypothetical protein